MKESARIALSYVRSHAGELGHRRGRVRRTRASTSTCPAGAIPKDGPSAGITMTTALASLLTGRPVKHTVGMTGEVTLQGRVLPIGGLKQKVLAAHAAGLTDVIIPERNRADLDDVPEDVREAMSFHPVMSLDEVLELALEPRSRLACAVVSCAPLPEEVRRAADLLERRWTVSILCASHEGAVRFNEFRQVLGPIPPATLAARLAELEEAGVLERARGRRAPAAGRVPADRRAGASCGALVDGARAASPRAASPSAASRAAAAGRYRSCRLRAGSRRGACAGRPRPCARRGARNARPSLRNPCAVSAKTATSPLSAET